MTLSVMRAGRLTARRGNAVIETPAIGRRGEFADRK